MSNIVFELFAKLGLDSSEYEKGLGDAKTKAGSIGGAITGGLKTVAKVGAAALGVATAAVGKFASDSIAAGSTFDKSMSQVAATMGNVDKTVGQDAEAMDKLRAKASELGVAFDETTTATELSNAVLRQFAQVEGQSTAYSASQAADALNFMALAGYDAATSVEMLPNVLNLAAAGNFDLARASDMVTDTQTAFGISLERTSQMVDEMAKASSTGNTSVEQLGDAFLVVGGLAKEMSGGMVELSDGTTATYDNIQELEIALTAMANAGIKGSEAGTHMRNMLLKLASPTKEGVAAFEDLGVTVFDNEGKMRSLSDIMGDLNNSMSNLTQEQKLQAISDIFNTRDVAAAEALMSAVGQDWDSIAESILDADGAAEAMAATQLDNLAGDVTLFKSALEGAQIAVSDQLTPSLRDFVKFGTEGLSTITKAFQEGGLTGAMDAFGTVLSDGLTMIISKVPDFINAGMQLLGALGKGLMDNIDIILFAIGDVAEMIMNGLLEATSGHDSAILEILDWILGVFNENYGNLIDVGFQIISNIITGIANGIPMILPTIIDLIGNIVRRIIDNAPLMLNAAIQLVQGLIDGFLAAIPQLVSMIPGLISALINALVKAVPMLINGAKSLIEGIVNALPSIIQALVEAIPLLIDAYINGLIAYLPILIEGLISLVMALVQALPTIIQVLTEAIPTIIQLVTDALLANLPQLIQGMIQLTIALVSALPTIVGALIEAIPQIITMIVQAIITSGPILIEAVIGILGTIGETLLSYGSTFIGNVGEAMAGILETVVTWLSQLPEKMAFYAGYAIGQFIAFFINLPSNLMNLLNQVITNVVAFGTSFKEKAIQSGKDFFNGIVDNLKNLPSRLKQLGAQLVSTFSSLPSKFLEIGTNIVKGLWNGIKNAWGWLTSQVSGLFGSLVSGIKSGLGIASPSKVFAEIGKYVDEGYAKGIIDNMDVIDNAMAGIEAMSVNPQISSSTIANSSIQNDIIRLLEEIADKDFSVVLEGDMDRVFRVIQRKSEKNKQITGQEAFA